MEEEDYKLKNEEIFEIFNKIEKKGLKEIDYKQHFGSPFLGYET
jgi:hypothetical protein